MIHFLSKTNDLDRNLWVRMIHLGHGATWIEGPSWDLLWSPAGPEVARRQHYSEEQSTDSKQSPWS
jgi:hypothetical protein